MPRTRTQMRRIREVLRLKFELQLSDARVALGARIARSTVQDYLRRIAASGLDCEQLLVPTIAESRVMIRHGDETDSRGDRDRLDRRGA
jgi:hypothetical protein